ncbi:MAG: sugar phosphate isomerase/epimerase [Victivallales bacterium]|nr:sugar phosphate isomerase/epimerase [Victivallales bacterium]
MYNIFCKKQVKEIVVTVKNVLPLGTLVRINDEVSNIFARLREQGFSTCQLVSPQDEYLYGQKAECLTDKLLTAVTANQITISSVFMSFKNQVWKYPGLMETVGFVPLKTRALRIARACGIANWAKKLKVEVLVAHVGFIPENRKGEAYGTLIEMLRELALVLKDNGQYFTFETGQESIAVLKNVIEDIGTSNLGINFDPANLLLYDMDSPAELVAKLGRYVMQVHCKDGKRPDHPGSLGTETPLGEGEVDFGTLLPALYAAGFKGPLIIENERQVGKEQRDMEIMKAKHLLENIKSDILKNNS